jgi:hypothetical protein
MKDQPAVQKHLHKQANGGEPTEKIPNSGSDSSEDEPELAVDCFKWQQHTMEKANETPKRWQRNNVRQLIFRKSKRYKNVRQLNPSPAGQIKLY